MGKTTVLAESNDQLRVTAPTKLAHIVFRTSRYEAMVRFYTLLLGAHVTFANEVLTFLTYDEEHHRIAVLNVPDLAQQIPAAAGVHHIAFTYCGLNELLSVYESLHGIGIDPVWCTNHGPTTSMYYVDPDGNQTELQVDNFDTVEEETAFFHSPEFAHNPIGVDFDPAELLRRLRAGEPEDKLKKRPEIGARQFDETVRIR